MKKLILPTIVLLFAISSISAQEDRKALYASNQTDLSPIDDELMDWLIGEWQGSIATASGQSTTWLKYEYMLNKQFISIASTSTMNGFNYEGKGAFTLKPESKEAVGYWADNMRGLYKGKGSRDHDMLKIIWYSNAGNTTRIIKKIDDNKFLLLISNPSKDGKIEEQRGEFIRIRDLTSDQ